MFVFVIDVIVIILIEWLSLLLFIVEDYNVYFDVYYVMCGVLVNLV